MNPFNRVTYREQIPSIVEKTVVQDISIRNLSTLKGVDAVRQAIKLLLTTSITEMMFIYDYGLTLYTHLFDTVKNEKFYSQLVVNDLRRNIKTATFDEDEIRVKVDGIRVEIQLNARMKDTGELVPVIVNSTL